MKTKLSFSRWLLSFSLIGSPAWSATITVAPSGGNYTKIQDAINAAAPNDTIQVAAGIYAENLSINKSLQLLGPNAGTSPNTGTRIAEAVIVPAASAITSGTLVDVSASDVTLDGFTLDGNNTALTSGYQGTNGADLDAAEGVAVNTNGVSRLTVTRNIIRNLSYTGVDIFGAPNYSATATSGHAVTDNLITDLGTYDTASGIAKWGIGLVLYNNQYAAVTGNVMSNVRIGFQTGNFQQANPGDPACQVFSNNTITTRRSGIFLNYQGAGGSPWTLSNNTVNGLADSHETRVKGIELSELAVGSTCSNNVINLAAVPATTETWGYQAWSVAATSPAVITGGSVSGVRIGVFVNNYEGYGQTTAKGAHVSLSNLSINLNPDGTGIQVRDSDNANNTLHGPVQLGACSNVTVTGGTRGLFLDGPNASVPLVGSLNLNGQSGSYIALSNNANSVDALGVKFDGTTGTAATLTTNLAIEDKILHKVDASALGLVRVKSNELFVTAASGSIQRGIDASSAGHTVLVGPGTFVEDVGVNKSLHLLGAGPALTTLRGTQGDATRDTLNISASDVEVAGFQITRTGNTVADWNDANGALNNQGVTISNCSGTLLHDNLITFNRNGIYLSNTNGALIRNNVITDNRTGMHLVKQAAGPTVEENEITNNWTMGVLFREELPNVGDTPGTVFRNNNISGNWYSQIDDRATSTAPRNMEKNWLGTASTVVTTVASGEPGYAGQIPVAFGGTATAPGSQPGIAGPASANIDHSPFLSLGTDTNVETTPGRGTYGFQGNLSSSWDGSTPSIVVNTPVVYANYFIPTGTTVTVTETGSLQAGELELAPGATLVVNGGELILGDGSKISGTFTIFNSFGSWDINGDTTFEISQTLALITDIHVAAGKTLTVNGGGELVLDGCVIDSQTPGSTYNINAETDGLLTIARCVVTDAKINVDTTLSGNLHSRIFDNSFTTSDIEASSVSKVYHNLFDASTNSASNTDLSSAFAAVDGWANVTSAAALQNKFTLEFNEPVNSTRTLDANGNLFVQPTDPVVMRMDVSALGSNAVTAAEALLGYNSGMLTLSGATDKVTPLGDWEVLAETAPAPSGIGIVDSALGLQLDAGEEGITAASTIANVNFTAGSAGKTLGFFRVQTNGEFNPDGTFVKDTRLTKSVSGSASYLDAFTANTGELIIDDSAPAIAVIGQTGTQNQPSVGTVDVFNASNYTIRNGTPLVLTFTATDAGLAGLDASDAIDDLELSATNGTTVLSDWTVSATESSGVVTYTVTLNVPANTTNGTYAVTATVIDRSGNLSPVASLGSFQIANEVLATVELQGFGGGNRDVTFTATNGAGAVLTSWTESVSFTGAVGTVPLQAVPVGTTAISAKTAWNLRSKKSATFSPEGVASVSLTGTDFLAAGDITGDNVVNTLDYSTLRYHWLTTHGVADINGDVEVNSSDYNLLVPNFYKVGDAQ